MYQDLPSGDKEIERSSLALPLQFPGGHVSMCINEEKQLAGGKGVSGVVLKCFFLSGVAESCPHSGLYDLKAHS